MNEATETGEDIQLTGKSGETYFGKIYPDKNSSSAISGRAIACLSNSERTNEGWNHRVNSIYNTENITDELEHFQQRDDISHLILLPYSSNQNPVSDKVDDLIRNYIHH